MLKRCAFGITPVWVLVGVGALTCVLSLLVRVPLHYLDPAAATGATIYQYQIALNNRLVRGDKLPAEVSELSHDQMDFPCQPVDAWRHPLKITSIRVDGVMMPVISSAGPDGRFGTKDDYLGLPLTPSLLSRLRVEALRDIIHLRLDHLQAVPLNPQELVRVAQLNSAQVLDGWARLLRITVRVVDGKPIYTIRSAGAQGQFDAPDSSSAITSYTKFPAGASAAAPLRSSAGIFIGNRSGIAAHEKAQASFA